MPATPSAASKPRPSAAQIGRRIGFAIVCLGVALLLFATYNAWKTLRGMTRFVEPPAPIAQPVDIPGKKPPGDFGLPQLEGATEFHSAEAVDRSRIFASYNLSGRDRADVVAFYRARLAAAGWGEDRELPISMPRPSYHGDSTETMTGVAVIFLHGQPRRRLELQVYDTRAPQADVSVVLLLRNLR